MRKQTFRKQHNNAFTRESKTSNNLTLNIKTGSDKSNKSKPTRTNQTSKSYTPYIKHVTQISKHAKLYIKDFTNTSNQAAPAHDTPPISHKYLSKQNLHMIYQKVKHRKQNTQRLHPVYQNQHSNATTSKNNTQHSKTHIQ